MLHMSMGHTGARRLPGAPGLLRVRCSLDEGWLEVRHTLQRATRELSEPKTEQAKRRIAVDEDTVAILRAHRVASLEASLAQPKRRKGADYLFTSREGTPPMPGTCSARSTRLWPGPVYRGSHSTSCATGSRL